ncbi:MAG: DUF2332 domain-containing protein [Aquihabitans sp.]
MIDDDGASLAAHFATFAEVAFRRLPLYRYLAEGVAQDREVAERLLLARPEQRWFTLLMASVHDRLLAGVGPDGSADDPLGEWYRSITDHPRPVGTGTDDPWPHFRRLALDDELVAANLATRSTQTNEVGRCLALLPALGGVTADHGAPLGLVEVGASAGLNLRFDHYGYRYRPDGSGAEDVIELDVDADLVLETVWRGAMPPPVPAVMPLVVHRAGVDLHPIDVTDEVAGRWLVACQWPEQPERLERCRQAVALAAVDPPAVRRGDAIATLAKMVDEVPEDVHPVVIATWFLAYLDPARQRAFLHELDRIARQRDITLVIEEQPSEVPGLDPPPRPDGKFDPGPTALCRYDWCSGHRTSVRLADQHPHVRWLEWLQ